MQNCTLYGGSMWLDLSNGDSYITAHDCIFDSTNITLAPSNPNGAFDDSHNAYLTNAATLPGEVGGPPPQTNFIWQPGPLGNYYLPPDSPLIDVGDKPASSIGNDPSPGLSYDLGIFTTQTNQGPEEGKYPAANVDIGYHYAAPLPALSFNNYGGPHGSPICPDGQWSFNLFNNNYGSTDLWGLPVIISIPMQPQHGSLTNTDNGGNYTYTATNCYAGTDSFTYQMNDGLFTSPPGHGLCDGG
ncbi:MAG TPA: Ig-like domain-containing protein [Verrucomicrobiae bacterium]|nr:Ig-like domain-containing protein [Verrucomicrobiae bacterium]